MIKWLFIQIFKKNGWTLKGGLPKDIKKCVLIGAPHTSNWDFIYSRAALYQWNIPLKLLVKDSLFFFPLGPILKSMGAIPVKRDAKTGMVEAMANQLKASDDLIILLAPEGTRSKVDSFKKGFYHTAKLAGVPIVCGYLDYENKVAAIEKVIYPGEDMEADLQAIYDYYKPIKGKHPEKGI